MSRQLLQVARRLLRSSLIGNVFWVMMLLVHLPAMVTRWHALLAGELAGAHTPGFVALNLSTLLFALKVARVSWLEFNTAPRSLMSFTIAVALLHAGVAYDAPPTAICLSQHVVAGTLLAASMVTVQNLVCRLSRASHGTRLSPGADWRNYVRAVRTDGRYSSLVLAPRAPPLS